MLQQISTFTDKDGNTCGWFFSLQAISFMESYRRAWMAYEEDYYLNAEFTYQQRHDILFTPRLEFPFEYAVQPDKNHLILRCCKVEFSLPMAFIEHRTGRHGDTLSHELDPFGVKLHIHRMGGQVVDFGDPRMTMHVEVRVLKKAEPKPAQHPEKGSIMSGFEDREARAAADAVVRQREEERRQAEAAAKVDALLDYLNDFAIGDGDILRFTKVGQKRIDGILTDQTYWYAVIASGDRFYSTSSSLDGASREQLVSWLVGLGITPKDIKVFG